MKSLLNTIFYSMLLFSCSSINNNDLSLGRKLSKEVLNTPSHLILMSPSQFVKGYYIKKKNILYSVGIDSDTKEIVYISVKAPSFTTKEGLKIGMKLSEVKKKVNPYHSRNEFNTGFSVSLKDDWNAFLLLEKDEYVIISFFKRKALQGSILHR